MKKKMQSILLVSLLASASCLAQTMPDSGFYQKVTTISSNFPGQEEEVVNVEIARQMGTNPLEIQAKPIHLKLHQKIGSLAVYGYSYNSQGWEKINGRQVSQFYYGLDKDHIDAEFLKVIGGQWGLSQYCCLGNTRDTYQFIPQKAGTTMLRYQWEKAVIEVPIVIDEDLVENNLPPVSDVVSE